MTQPILSDSSKIVYNFTPEIKDTVISTQDVFNSLLGQIKDSMRFTIVILFIAAFLRYTITDWLKQKDFFITINGKEHKLTPYYLFTLDTVIMGCAVVLLNYAVQF